MMMLTVVIPALLRSQQETLPPLHTPALNHFLRFGHVRRQVYSKEQLFLQYLCPAIQLEHNEVLASPIWQKMGLHSMSILDGHAIGVHQQEALQLCQDLNDFYQQELFFTPIRPDLWKLCLPSPPNWVSPSIWEVCGQIDGTIQAEGEDRTVWLKYSTELQMWLHLHPINQQRRTQKLPEINGVWLWNAPNLVSTPAPLIGSNSPWASSVSAPQTWEEWLDVCQQQGINPNQSLLFLDDLMLSQHTDDIWHYQDILQNWDRLLFSPMQRSLQSGQLQGIQLICEVGSVTLLPRSHWFFWQKKRVFNGKTL